MISLGTTDEHFSGKRVLVTGSSGFIGSHLVSALVQRGADVLGVDRQPASSTTDCPSTLLTVDLSSLEETVSVFADFQPDYVYHLASAPDAQEEFQQVARSINGGLVLTVNLLEAFRQHPGDLFVFGDSSKVYGDPGVAYREALVEDPLSSYAIAKSAAWQFCKYHQRLYGTNVVSIRPTLVYGSGQPRNLISYVLETILKGKTEIKLMGGKQTRDPLHCSDLVSAYLALPRHRGRIAGRVINLGGGREIAIIDLVQQIAGLMETDLRIETDDSQVRPTDSARSFCSNEDALELIGWQPEVNLESGLSDLIAQQAEFQRLNVL